MSKSLQSVDPMSAIDPESPSALNAFSGITARSELGNIADTHRVASAKITHAFSHAEQTVTDLGCSISAISDDIRRLAKQSEETTDLDILKAHIHQYCDALTRQIHEAVTALQFYDLLSQRMEKVRWAVNGLGQLLTETERSTPSSNQQRDQQLADLRQALIADSGGKTVGSDDDHELFVALADSGQRRHNKTDCELF